MRWSELSDLVTTPSNKPHMARVVQPWVFWSERLGCKVEVPTGFEFDWDSVPRWPVVYLLFKGRMKQESCAHDYLYKTGTACGEEISCRTADLVMLDAMKALGRKKRWRYPIYLGVRLGGWIAWLRHRKRGE